MTKAAVPWEAEAMFGSWHTLGLSWDESLLVISESCSPTGAAASHPSQDQFGCWDGA